MLMPAEALITFVLASVLLSLAPGPDNIFVVTQSALYGNRTGILVTLGLCTGLLVHTAAVVFGVAAVIQASALAFTLLKLLGALYLLWLAWQAFHASGASLDTPRANVRSAGELYRRGIIMNITNPKVSIFFLAFLPQFASPDHGPVAQQLLLLGAVFIVVALAVFGLMSILAGSIGSWLQRSPKSQVYLNRMAGTVFAALALRLALSTRA